MSDFVVNSFSSIGTSTHLSDDSKTIRKLVSHNCCSQDIVIPLYLSYIDSLSQSTIALPTSVYPLDSGVCIEQPYYGHKLYTHNDAIDFDLLFFLLPQIASLFEYASFHKIYIDPHLSNFHVHNHVVKLIDISPPYSTAYNYYVNRKCSSKIEQFFLMKNCLFFRWDYLPFHFVGDLTDISESSVIYLQQFYEFFKPLLPRSIFFSDFVEKSFMIRHHENLRSKLNFNLL